MKKVFNLIKDEYLQKFSFIILLFWTISPMIEYILKNIFNKYYTYYFSFMIYIIGMLGILLYIVYIIKLELKKELSIKKFIPEIIIIILLIISIISTVLSENLSLSLFGESYRKEGLIVYIMYIGFLLLSSIIKDSKYIKYIFKSIILSALIITVFPLLNCEFTYLNFSNVFHNFNHYGYYLMINIMLSGFMFINNKKIVIRVVYLLIYIFFTYLLIRNDTFGSFLAIGISLLLLFIYSIIKKYQRLSIISLIIVFIIISFSVSHFDIKIGERVNFESNKGVIAKNILFFSRDIKNIVSPNEKDVNNAGNGRGLLWKEAINYTLAHPIIGGGMECLKDHYIKTIKYTYNDRPHNIILQVSSFIGIPGAIIYIGLILYIAISNLKIMKQDTTHIMIYFTAMCYFTSSIFGNSMYYTSPYFMILLGILIGYTRFKKEKVD